MVNIGFVGAGMMAEAIISGMLKGGFPPEEIRAADPDATRREYITAKYHIQTQRDNPGLAGWGDLLILAVKPQYYPGVVPELRQALTDRHRLISIMAGVTTARLESDLSRGGESGVLPVVRVMPNSPAMVGAGITCLCPGSGAEPKDLDLARKIFETVGTVIDLEERLIDAATGVAGCGPAYAYMMIEAMADGGVMMGLPRRLALKLAAETLNGAARMMLADQGHPEELKDRVCSPGGATIEGVFSLEKAGFRGALIEAVKAGADKCKSI